MSGNKEVQATENKNTVKEEKKEVQEKAEKTTPLKFYSPLTDIMESKEALSIVMDVPGVKKEGVNIQLKDNVLNIEAHIEPALYGEVQPVYSEYNLGHFSRKFSLSNQIDQEKIEAKIANGTLTLTLPKAAEVEPRRIAVR